MSIVLEYMYNANILKAISKFLFLVTNIRFQYGHKRPGHKRLGHKKVVTNVQVTNVWVKNVRVTNVLVTNVRPPFFIILGEWCTEI